MFLKNIMIKTEEVASVFNFFKNVCEKHLLIT